MHSIFLKESQHQTSSCIIMLDAYLFLILPDLYNIKLHYWIHHMWTWISMIIYQSLRKYTWAIICTLCIISFHFLIKTNAYPIIHMYGLQVPVTMSRHKRLQSFISSLRLYFFWPFIYTSALPEGMLPWSSPWL